MKLSKRLAYFCSLILALAMFSCQNQTTSDSNKKDTDTADKSAELGGAETVVVGSSDGDPQPIDFGVAEGYENAFNAIFEDTVTPSVSGCTSLRNGELLVPLCYPALQGASRTNFDHFLDNTPGNYVFASFGVLNSQKDGDDFSYLSLIFHRNQPNENGSLNDPSNDEFIFSNKFILNQEAYMNSQYMSYNTDPDVYEELNSTDANTAVSWYNCLRDGGHFFNSIYPKYIAIPKGDIHCVIDDEGCDHGKNWTPRIIWGLKDSIAVLLFMMEIDNPRGGVNPNQSIFYDITKPCPNACLAAIVE